jgi:osmotically-inducible protein OsmY
MRALRDAAAAFTLAVLLMVAGHAEADDRAAPQPVAAEKNAYEKAKGEALDAYIAGRLITAYGLSEHLSPFEIGVEVMDGRIVLTGAVETQVHADLALEIAYGIEQARAVESKITVDPQAPRNESAGRQNGFTSRFSDAGITARVKTRLFWNGSTSALSVTVDTERRAVTLSGTVDSSAESELAEQIALNTQGVERVTNRLHIAPRSDAQLRARRN